MCGIAGFLSKERPPAGAETVLGNMTKSLAHRGPDGQGLWVDDSGAAALGHRRLAIIDLSETGLQPMRSASGRYVITFNGEIYNYREMRGQLESRGIKLRGSSDTEVLLETIALDGIAKTLAAANGMFALALWDRQERTLTLARDRIGQKPLYYGWRGKTLLFASELKAFRHYPGFEPRIDQSVLDTFTRYAWIPGPHTIWQGIKKLPPGTYATISLSARHEDIVPQPYWTVRDALAGKPVPEAESKERLKNILRRAVSECMVSDVPLGAFLSGGVDSSLIAALMQEQSAGKVRTFSIGFHDEAYDEAPYAKAVAGHLGTEHTELYVTANNLMDVIPSLPEIYDEPFADISQIPVFLMCEMAREKVTVCLSGDGGDELFGGYARYSWSKKIACAISALPAAVREPLCAMLQTLPLPWNRGKIQRLAYILAAPTPQLAYIRLLSSWPRAESLAAKSKNSAGLADDVLWLPPDDFRRQMQIFDIQQYLPGDILTKTDRASMANALEVRVPLLDHRLIEFALALPHEKSKKALLREVLYDYVPPALLDRPKKGFDLPLAAWLRGDLRQWAEELLSLPRLEEHGFLNPPLIRKAWQTHLSGKCDLHYPLWNILVLQSWLEHQKAES